MTSVTIGLRDEELRRYFNEMHAALKKAESGYATAAQLNLGDGSSRPRAKSLTSKTVFDNKFIDTPRAIQHYKKTNSELIAALQAIIEEVQKASSLAR